MTAEAHALRSFFRAHQYAVVGASTDRSKFGNKVLRWYQERQLPVTPVHPTQTRIEGEMAVRSLSDVMDGAANAYEARTSVSIVTPPHVSLGLLKYYVHDPRVIAMWLQPGAADGPVIQWIRDQKDEIQSKIVYSGVCVLVVGDAHARESGRL